MRRAHVPSPRRIAWLYTLTGALGLVASLSLTSYYFGLSERDGVACGPLPFTACAAVVSRDQMELAGLPAPLLGVAWFTVLTSVGVAMLVDADLGRTSWLGLQIAASAAVISVHWLMVVALFHLGVARPAFVAVWTATIASFWFTTVRNTTALGWDPATPKGRVAASVAARHVVVLTIWLAAVGLLVAIRVWAARWMTRFV